MLEIGRKVGNAVGDARRRHTNGDAAGPRGEAPAMTRRPSYYVNAHHRGRSEIAGPNRAYEARGAGPPRPAAATGRPTLPGAGVTDQGGAGWTVMPLVHSTVTPAVRLCQPMKNCGGVTGV
jgi:hypothetical protein